MSMLPTLLFNSQFVLDNFFTLKKEDFLNTDLEFNKFVFEYSNFHSSPGLLTATGELIENENKPASLNYYGGDFFEKLKLGKGAFGGVLQYNDKTLKVFNLMGGKDSNQFEFVHTYDKYIIPYRLYEGIASTCVNYLISKYTNCYYQTCGTYLLTSQVFYDNEQTDKFSKSYITEWDIESPDFVDMMQTCMSMEKLEPIPLFFYNKGRKELYYVLFIILSNINILRNICRFVHGDLHLKNIMMITSTDDVKLTYDDQIITIPNLGWRPVLIDFGYSSFDYEKKRVSSNLEARAPSGSNFDSYFDLAKIFGSLLNFRDIQGETDFTDAEEIFSNVSGKSYDFYIDAKHENKYKLLMQNNILKPLPEVLNFLISKIQYTSTKTIGVPKYIDKFYEIVHFNQASLQINPFIKYYNVKYKTIEPFWKHEPYSTILNVHVLEMNGHVDDYKFINRCCKQTVFDFVSQQEGVAINGTYFDMTHGNYIKKVRTDSTRSADKKTRIETYYYADVYGTVKVLDNMVLIRPSSNTQMIQHKSYATNNINPIFTDPNTNQFLAAPVIVSDTSPFPLDLSRTTYGEYMFTCSDDASKFTDQYSNVSDDKDANGVRMHNCKLISEGELYHIGNPNPRTVLATKGDTTYFIVIEGRTEEYKGATYDQMQDFLINYLKVDWGINLDGGASSMMMWNIGGIVYTPLKVTNRKTIGNCLGFIKK